MNVKVFVVAAKRVRSALFHNFAQIWYTWRLSQAGHATPFQIPLDFSRQEPSWYAESTLIRRNHTRGDRSSNICSKNNTQVTQIPSRSHPWRVWTQHQQLYPKCWKAHWWVEQFVFSITLSSEMIRRPLMQSKTDVSVTLELFSRNGLGSVNSSNINIRYRDTNYLTNHQNLNTLTLAKLFPRTLLILAAHLITK